MSIKDITDQLALPPKDGIYRHPDRSVPAVFVVRDSKPVYAIVNGEVLDCDVPNGPAEVAKLIAEGSAIFDRTEMPTELSGSPAYHGVTYGGALRDGIYGGRAINSALVRNGEVVFLDVDHPEGEPGFRGGVTQGKRPFTTYLVTQLFNEGGCEFQRAETQSELNTPVPGLEPELVS